ncbi:hypothetical protein, partial [Kitasatospora sp. NPDC056531]|uniref:hypothetical protein n=1 Tax=Kitasatospora sp. NPDC056531 TaxID=3345856 RepID=UPI003698DF3A
MLVAQLGTGEPTDSNASATAVRAAPIAVMRRAASRVPATSASCAASRSRGGGEGAKKAAERQPKTKNQAPKKEPKNKSKRKKNCDQKT